MPGASDTVLARLQAVRARIAAAARAAGRAPDSVRIIAVSKTYPVEHIEAALSGDQRDFGESTIQEALLKIERLRAHALSWHFVGHLQSNKAKFIPGNFAWLHSLDSVALATRLERLAAERSATLDALIEVNLTRDPRKHGIPPEQLDETLDAILHAGLTHIRLRGLMTIGPAGANTDTLRACFARLRELRDRERERLALAHFSELSMGMSGDYLEAIKEGTTMIRLGTAVFGERIYRR